MKFLKMFSKDPIDPKITQNIHEAIINGNELQIRNMVEDNKLDLNKKDKYGNSLLHYAVMSGNESSVKAMLDLKANPKIRNLAGQTPLELAQSLGGDIAKETAFQLDEHLRVEMVRKRGFDKDFVKNLIQGGADPFSKDLQGNSAMQIAKAKGPQKEDLLQGIFVDSWKKQARKDSLEKFAGKLRESLKSKNIFSAETTIRNKNITKDSEKTL